MSGLTLSSFNAQIQLNSRWALRRYLGTAVSNDGTYLHCRKTKDLKLDRLAQEQTIFYPLPSTHDKKNAAL
jgi:hypothetical protein